MKIAANGLGLFCLSTCLAVSVQSLGCAYALPVPSPPSHELVRIVAKSPEAYVFRVDAGLPADYPVPPDGRLRVLIPAHSRGCSVYLFNVMRVSNGHDPLKDWTAHISIGGRSVRTLSLRELARLPVDSEGYHLLGI